MNNRSGINIKPTKVVLVGASSQDESLSGQLHRNVLSSWPASQIDLINPKLGGTKLRGSSVYSSLRDSPGNYDMAFICVRSDSVVGAVDECGQMGINTCVIYSSGFSEIGESGERLERQLESIAEDYGIRLIGPNSQGLILSQVSLVGTFSQAAANRDLNLRKSNIAYVGQSGAIGGSVLGMLSERGIGISDWITVGNQTDIDCVTAAITLVESGEYSAIGLYLEDLPDGDAWRRLVRLCQEAETKIVLLRSGLTELGKKAAASHTGSIVGDSHSFDVFSADAGVIASRDVSQFVEILVLAASSFAELRSPHMTVLTSSGGVGALCADLATFGDIDLATISEEARQNIARHIPKYGSSNNPVDVTAQLFSGDPKNLKSLSHVLEALAEGAQRGFTLIALTNVIGGQARAVAQEIADVQRARGGATAVLWLTNGGLITEAVSHLRQNGIPVVSDLPQFLENVSKVVFSNLKPSSDHDSLEKSTDTDGSPLFSASGSKWSRSLTSWEYGLLEKFGVETVPAHSLDPRRDMTAPSEWVLGNPWEKFVVKIDSPHVQHKTEVGGVKIGVAAQDLSSAVGEVWSAVNCAVPNVDHESISLQYQVPPGPEILVSLTGPSNGFPPIITVGMGGVTIELFKDLNSSIAPVNASEVMQLLKGLTVFPLLEGYRGMRGIDLEMLCSRLSSLSMVAARLPENSILEINPIRVVQGHVYGLDSLLTTK